MTFWIQILESRKSGVYARGICFYTIFMVCSGRSFELRRFFNKLKENKDYIISDIEA